MSWWPEARLSPQGIQRDFMLLRFLGGPATPTDTWRMAKFGPDAQDALVAADIADPDRDGMHNLLEYGLGGDPLKRVTTGYCPP